jgi:hypothetical protein
MPAGDASLKTAQVNQNAIDSNHGIYREPVPSRSVSHHVGNGLKADAPAKAAER